MRPLDFKSPVTNLSNIKKRQPIVIRIEKDLSSPDDFSETQGEHLLATLIIGSLMVVCYYKYIDNGEASFVPEYLDDDYCDFDDSYSIADYDKRINEQHQAYLNMLVNNPADNLIIDVALNNASKYSIILTLIHTFFENLRNGNFSYSLDSTNEWVIEELYQIFVNCYMKIKPFLIDSANTAHHTERNLTNERSLIMSLFLFELLCLKTPQLSAMSSFWRDVARTTQINTARSIFFISDEAHEANLTAYLRNIPCSWFEQKIDLPSADVFKYFQSAENILLAIRPHVSKLSAQFLQEALQQVIRAEARYGYIRLEIALMWLDYVRDNNIIMVSIAKQSPKFNEYHKLNGAFNLKDAPSEIFKID